MAVFRVEKTRDFTVMSNHHLRNKALSLKAKGLQSLMLSLPETWDFTTKGLSYICKDGVDSITSALNELEQQGYYTKHSAEIEAFKDARGYLNAVMNGRTDPPPIKNWRAEQTNLTAAKYALCERYYALQAEVRSVEQLRKGAENIMREDVQERQPHRVQDMEL